MVDFSIPTRQMLNLLLLSVCICLSACDPGQVFRIENQSGGDASVKIVLKPGPRDYVFDELSESDTILIELGTEPVDSYRDYVFGIGHWEVVGALDGLISMVDHIELKTQTTTQTYRGEEELRTFFKDRIQGRMKEQIVVVLE